MGRRSRRGGRKAASAATRRGHGGPLAASRSRSFPGVAGGGQFGSAGCMRILEVVGAIQSVGSGGAASSTLAASDPLGSEAITAGSDARGGSVDESGALPPRPYDRSGAVWSDISRPLGAKTERWVLVDQRIAVTGNPQVPTHPAHHA